VQLDTMYSDVHGRAFTVVFNRPAVLNCVNEAWVRDFHTMLDHICSQPQVRVVVLRGAGRAFCSGIDVRALSEGAISQGFFRAWEDALRRLETMEPLVVAAIHSHCIGGGLQMALAADLRLARDDARFGVTAGKEGIIPGLGVWRIARHAGLGRAKRLAFTGDIIDAATALGWGLVDYVADASGFEAGINDLTRRLLDMTWTSTRLTKKLSNSAFDSSFAEILEVFSEYQRISTDSPEHAEAMAERRRSRRAALAADPGSGPKSPA
jgi:enoyl-CoA hydratase/carnithine racemase